MATIIKSQPSDTEIIAEWKAMLSVFADIIKGNPPVEKVKQKLIDLKAAARKSKLLTYRQVDAITSRCDNYIAGTYDVDTKKDAYIKSQKKEAQ